MADKTVTADLGVTPATIATAGTIVVDKVEVIFDEDTETTTVLELLERARVAIIVYYSNKSS